MEKKARPIRVVVAPLLLALCLACWPLPARAEERFVSDVPLALDQGQGGASAAATEGDAQADTLATASSGSTSGVTSQARLSFSDLQSQYWGLSGEPRGWDAFSTRSDTSAYTAGVLSGNAISYGASYISLIRRQAGLPDVTITDSLNANAAQGALILARMNDSTMPITHDPSTPSGVTDAQAKPGKYATSTSNLSAYWASWSDVDFLGYAI